MADQVALIRHFFCAAPVAVGTTRTFRDVCYLTVGKSDEVILDFGRPIVGFSAIPMSPRMSAIENKQTCR
jgi:hypothetical protein